MHRGVVYGLVAYLFWGVLPLYWKLLQSVPASEILAHRIVWSLLFCSLLVLLRQGFGWLPPLLKQRRSLLMLLAASMLLTLNWGLYIWAVNEGRVVETSLGYFINPLVSIALGVLVLRERLEKLQWAAIALATMGVCFLIATQDQLPWIAICLACSFGVYGLLKNQLPLPVLQGLSVETALMMPPTLAFLIWLSCRGELVFAQDAITSLKLGGAGIVTAIPLLFFAAAAQRIPLSLLGLLQYLGPTMQFCIGVFIYKEAFPTSRLIGFMCIWLALSLLTAQALRRR